MAESIDNEAIAHVLYILFYALSGSKPNSLRSSSR